jgi:hypothetical protein
MRLPSLALVIALSTGSIYAQSPATSTPEGKAVAFTQRLLSAMSRRDVDTLAGMFRFPVTVHTGSVALPIASSAVLAKSYDTVFTPELGCALERSTQGAGGRGADDSIRKEGDGLSVGRGAVHLQPSGDSFAITRIDEPAGASPAAPRSQPRHVDVPSGQVQFAGTLAVGGVDRYVVSVRQGDVLQARVERFQGRAIGVRIVDVKSGRAFSNGTEAARVVSATAGHTGDIAVDVTRLTFCEPSASYLLTLSKHR